ncbi:MULTISPECIES: 2-oxo-4-hydroxy-4-carboxy-5-ureidoimidazoline decarboxylase [unclassified Marinobacter]|uniref:2-oxo-4-hydroxy-4-carboxy-5-ureidoimidazoline decarboxylase n=1 Tax=unclassified Marinobacter TaxID=83889 RepID=UPI0026E305C8|nr:MULTISPECIES: 2-oxo-4-hydroxy-4-carboxy-5-ureidoimidazoline decarboxylase [unclassified Marinobacter]MDO6443147.1 2-oxo-4-hydroxy-4-carboxy-5-ureidoimidazoline decarboxylase [Marinobacter sp. 2_MG-2023]MDO6822633.1 2-oxo-4-hydroxy-4-carboxy-5-ureidoimidazoline decarboxylase [Marinobacter sp. 1_MG-2023]
MTAETINTLPRDEAESQLRNCCAAETWVQGMLRGLPYSNQEALLSQSRKLWPKLSEQDWLQAFTAHPKIGDINSLRAKYASTRAMASGEQAGARQAPEEILQRLKTGNDAYLEKFGFIFIVCATGKSAAEMLELLEARLPRTRAQEVETAAAEQAKITELRLEKLL